jgi:hypothetical protein
MASDSKPSQFERPFEELSVSSSSSTLSGKKSSWFRQEAVSFKNTNDSDAPKDLYEEDFEEAIEMSSASSARQMENKLPSPHIAMDKEPSFAIHDLSFQDTDDEKRAFFSKLENDQSVDYKVLNERLADDSVDYGHVLPADLVTTVNQTEKSEETSPDATRTHLSQEHQDDLSSIQSNIDFIEHSQVLTDSELSAALDQPRVVETVGSTGRTSSNDDRPIKPLVPPLSGRLSAASTRKEDSIRGTPSRLSTVSRSSDRSSKRASSRTSSKQPTPANISATTSMNTTTDQLLKENQFLQQLLDDEKLVSSQLKEDLAILAAKYAELQESHAIVSAETQDLRRQLQLQEKAKKQIKNDDSPPREEVVQEQERLLQGFQKDIDRLVTEKKQLKEEMKEKENLWQKERERMEEDVRELQTIVTQQTGTSPAREQRRVKDLLSEIDMMRKEHVEEKHKWQKDLEALKQTVKSKEQEIKERDAQLKRGRPKVLPLPVTRPAQRTIATSPVKSRVPAPRTKPPTVEPEPSLEIMYTQTQVDEMRERYVGRIDELERMVATMDSTLKARDALPLLLSQAEQDRTRDEMNRLRGTITELQVKNRNLDQRHTSEVAALQRLLNEYQSTPTTTNEERVGPLKARIQALEQELRQLRQSLPSESEVKQLQEDLVVREKQLEALTKESDTHRSESIEALAKWKQSERMALQWEQEAKALRRSLQTVQSQLDALAASMPSQQQLHQLKQENEKLRIVVEAGEELRVTLHEQYRRLLEQAQETTAKAVLGQNEKTLKLLQEEAIRASNERQQHEMQHWRDRATTAETQLTKARQEMAQLSVASETLQERHRLLEKRLQEAAKSQLNMEELEELRSANARLQEQVDLLSMTADQKTQMVHGLMLKLDQIEQRMRRRQSDMNRLSEKIRNEQQEESRQLQRKYEEMMRKKDEQLRLIRSEFEALMQSLPREGQFEKQPSMVM